jgi:filamentous hemagglutinin
MWSDIAAAREGAIAARRHHRRRHRYSQIGSDVIALGGDIDILAKDVQITEARETYRSQSKESYSQSGVTLGVKAPLLDTMREMQGTSTAMGDTSDDRMKALGAAAIAMNGYSAYQDIAKAAATDAPAGSVSMGMKLSVGNASSDSTYTERSDTAAGSRLQAGGNVVIKATGGGRDSNILMRGSDVDAGRNVDLKPDNAITIEAARDTVNQSSTHRSSNASVGVAMSFGETNGFTLEVAAGHGKGSDGGTDSGYTASRITAGNKVSLDSGGDTTIRGGVVSGKRVEAEVGGNLRIETPQNTSTYQGQDSGSNFEASVCIYACSGGGASAGAHSTKGQGNFASIGEQSGIRAGDGGFDVDVKGNTTLRGGVISSTQEAVDEKRNSFKSGSLTMEDLQNHDTFRGSGYSVNVSTSSTGNGAGVGSKDVDQSSTTRSGTSGIAGNTEVRTGVDTSNALKATDVGQAMRDVNAQVLITSTATGFAIQVGPALASDISTILSRMSSGPAGSGQPPETAKMTPAERKALVAGEIDGVLKNNPQLTADQRAALSQLKVAHEEIEQILSDSYDRAPLEGGDSVRKVGLVSEGLKGLLGLGGPGGAAGRYDPQTDTYTPGTALPSLSDRLDGVAVPPSTQLIIQIVTKLGQAMLSTNGGGDTSGAKPDREQRPAGLPTDTKPIDKDKRLDRGLIHDIKRGLGARDWVGVSPDGTVWINEGGNAVEWGQISDWDRSDKRR